jgi:hypothetical protein
MFLLNCYKVGLALAIALVTRWVCEAMACANGITQIQSHGKKVASVSPSIVATIFMSQNIKVILATLFSCSVV